MPPLNKFQKSFIAIAVGQALVPTSLQAATITVDTPGTLDGCTLYDAFDSANTDTSVGGECVSGSGADVIVLPSSEIFELDNSKNINEVGLLVSSEITVQGNTSAIRRAYMGVGDKRIIDVTIGGNLTLNDIELSRGQLEGDGGGAAVRVTSASLTINDSTLRNNHILDSDNGGAIFADSATVSLNNVVLYGNSASYGGAIYARNTSLSIHQSKLRTNDAETIGGAIHITGSGTNALTITESNFRANHAGGYGGAIASSESAVVINDSRLDNNRVGGEDGGCCSPGLDGGEGGAIYLNGAELTVTDTSFSRNRAGAQGSAIKVGDNARLIANRSNFADNLVYGDKYGGAFDPLIGITTGGASLTIGDGVYGSSGYGGAIAIATDFISNNSITNSTLSHNRAPYGGAILIGGEAVLNITNTTIVGGEGGKYGGEFGGEGNISGNAIYSYGASSLNLANSVISHSVSAGSGNFFKYQDLCGFEASAGLINGNINNFFQDDTCDGNEDGDPRLANATKYKGSDVTPVFGGEGGYTYISKPTHDIFIPLFDSPLQNAGDFTICSSAPVGGVDERGIAHAESHCDIGAIDSRHKLITVNHTGDDVADGLVACTLRDALISAQGGEGGESAPGGGEARPGSTCGYSYDQTTIRFDTNVFPPNGQTTINLASGYQLPSLTGVISIEGPSSKASGLTIQGGGVDSRIFRARRVNLYMNGMTLTGGEVDGSGGAMLLSSSVVTLDRMTLTDNSASSDGGAIKMSSSTAYITKSTISNNYAGETTGSPEGGGIYARNDSFLFMVDSTVSGNRLKPDSDADGGGIKVEGGTFAAILNSTISGNSANKGGGIHTERAFTFVDNSTISNNYAIDYGGGVYTHSYTKYKYGYDLPSSNLLVNSIISGNTAGSGGNEIAIDGGPTALPPKYAVYGTTLKYSILGDASETFDEAFLDLDPASPFYEDGSLLLTSHYGGGAVNPNSTPLNGIIKPLSNSSSRVTQTHDLVSGSPAIDNADDSRCDEKDQLGRTRSDGACDIGSVEFDKETFYVIKAANGNVIVFSL